ncbi:hypothetical protein [Psychroflexus planctonicus]|uniref:Outer membrane protein beta-barrel domain-containing protein n=1 Tax=Psychroflexus planctonicus TaxID=1526575 RepID=A0ABQ1SFD2_9FLAO|nr:hypothetical protein [Psychroflexus planctonicus]GGE35224.1 hypothetical protein GCM10010832_14220 [Psychroflexus planctonicus]
MKKTLLLVLTILVFYQFSIGQEERSKGSFEFSVLGSEFVDKTSIGFSLAASTSWHEYFQIGFGFQSAFHSQENSFSYAVGSPYYTASALTINNIAQLYSIGDFFIEANANFGVLNISLQDQDFQDFNPVLGISESEAIAQEFFRLFQGGITLSYIITKKDRANISIFVRTLNNQAFGNVRFGGKNGNSNFQFNLGIKLNAF